jgi:hypothetical protein
MAKKSQNGMTEAEVVPVEQQALPLTATPDAEKAPATPAAPVAPGSLIKEFTVPPEQQEPLRKVDATGAAIQRELGSLELQYMATKGRLLQAFEANRQEYEKLLKEAGKTVGVDFEKLTANERWDFDFGKMTFKHVELPKAS